MSFELVPHTRSPRDGFAKEQGIQVQGAMNASFCRLESQFVQLNHLEVPALRATFCSEVDVKSASVVPAVRGPTNCICSRASTPRWRKLKLRLSEAEALSCSSATSARSLGKSFNASVSQRDALGACPAHVRSQEKMLELRIGFSSRY